MDLFGGRNLEEDEVRRVIEHVCLPPKLPGSEAESLIVSDESNILALLTSVIQQSYSTKVPQSTRKLFELWADIQSTHVPTAENISKAISNLGSNDMFGYYVRSQNAAFMVSIDNSGQQGTISTFPASLKSGTVMTADDLVCSYPEQSITIPKSELLGSQALARQLVTLTNETMVDTLEVQNGGTEIREVPDTVYVSEWLTCLLSNKNSKLDSEFPTICKKVRDNVTWDNAKLPFRRSGMFMSMKVILHLSLLRSKMHTPENCLVLYKIIMAESLRRLCEAGESHSLEPDTGMFMMKKLARRVMKLKKLNCTSPVLKSEIDSLHRNVSATIKSWKGKMVTEWKNQIEKGSTILEPLTVDNSHVVHKTLPDIPKLDELTKNYVAPNEAPECFPRHRVCQTNKPNVSKLIDGLESEALGNTLFDIEAWIFHNMESQNVSHLDLRQFCIDYIKTAAPYYKESKNPIGASRMILAFLKIVRALDRIGVQNFPLLQEHRVGVDCKIFEQLLLPLRSDLELAYELEVYFSNRDRVAEYPSLVEEDDITNQSFSVRYATGNEEMCALRDKILAEAEDKIKGKLGEVKEAKRRCAEYRRKIDSLHCTGGDLIRNGAHINACAKCYNVHLVDEYRVEVYERPLRNDSESRLAVVFELLIPSEIACIRDVLTLVLSDICHAKKKSYEIDTRIWTSYFQIAEYNQGSPKFFKLGSTRKSVVDSHYKEKHPDCHEDQFIVDNNYNCTFDGTFKKTSNVKDYCTLRVHKDSVYSVLDWTLKSTAHTQNQVLAKQSECPHELRLSEYKEFGSLRAGHRLQLRNILRSLIEKTLSLKEEAVFTLICQALWETGSQVEGESSWYRDSHADLVNKNFTEELLSELKNLWKTYEHNWAEPYTLLATIVLTCRVLEFGQVTDEAAELIMDCRRTAFDWIKRIESKISDSGSESSLAHKRELKSKLVDACICLCWTYSVGDQYLDKVLKSEEDLFHWLHAMTRIYNNSTSTTTSKLSPMKTILLRQVQNIALNIEPKLANFVRTGFELFVKENWNEARNGSFDGWTCFPNLAQQVYHTNFRRPGQGNAAHLQVDLLRGSFLIDGFPVGYLSESITKHLIFSRTFKNIIFEVLPAAEANFITSHEFNGAFYLFTLLSDGNTLIVTEERRATGETFQLIPFPDLKRLIPLHLAEEYSHWLNLATNCIDFRPVCFEDFQNSKTTFQFNLGTRKLVEVGTGREVFSVSSDTHTDVSKFLSRLEHPNYIHTFLDSSSVDPAVIVELPRMNLHFKFNKKECTLESLEYNMLVRLNQNINTLIGLESGLVVENKFNELKVLMPHGIVFVKTPNSRSEHQKIQVEVKALKKPTVFTFDVDSRLQKLRAGKTCTGWLYLAYLHARTSSALADPFTGLTGTELAFNILQSGHCWSCKPYGPDSMVVLDAIRKLSPVRKFYPLHLERMEHVSWPKGLPVHGAHDGFRLIVDKLVDDSTRLKSLFQKAEEDKKEKLSDGNIINLTHRAYLRYEGLCSRELQISRKFCDIPVAKMNTKTAANGRKWTTDEDIIKSTRWLAELGHSWTFSAPESISLVTDLVSGHDALIGLNNTKLLLPKMSIIELLTLDFRNSWIDLYDLARDEQSLKSEWVVLLTTLAFGGVDLNQLLLLHGVAVKRVFFQTQEPPTVAQYINPSHCHYNETEVLSTIASYNHGESYSQACVLSTLLEIMWPIDSCKIATFKDLPRSCVNLNSTIGSLNSKLSNWNTNRKLDEFLKKVETTTRKLPGAVSASPSQIANMNFQPAIASFKASRIELTDFSDIVKEIVVSEDIAKIFKSEIGQKSLSGSAAYTSYEGSLLLAHLRNESTFYENRVQEINQKINECFIFPETEFLYQSDLVKLTPTSLLRRLLNSDKSKQNVHVLIGALGVLWTLEQRVKRCQLYYSMEGAGKAQLYREQENPGHENWIPADHPEWLLFEIEMNLMIRSVQIDVARQMISPPLNPGKKHAVMQLNMGEGKTAVIVPLLALSLANRNQLCRVTVLKSLFTTNFASLVNNLGGLLNRRIYIFPCRRDMPINGQTADVMLKLYQECKEQQGVVLTLPEYRLSFQLKGYEKSRAKEFQDARSLVNVQKWLADNVRDVLDESDEILHAKYQLIYTLGSQLSVDGGQRRWFVAQSLLRLIPARAVELQAKFGDESVDASSNGEEPEIFHHTRLLRRECYQQLIEWLAEDILDGKAPGIKLPLLRNRNKQLARDLLTKTDIDKETHDEALGLFESVQQEAMLILMGYLKHEILYLALSKRWRVNYGVDRDGDRKMAIPFRAKDLPAKRTEFGHPDVAIMLTQLSYYYSGLSNEELEECFVRLNFIPNKEREYASWIKEIPESRNVDPSIQDFSSINLTDYKQKHEILFPVLKRNILVVDFWLSQTVFFRESRAFEKKLACTAWDLCPESFKNPVTGFSGTNDSTVLLPLAISQEDLPALQNTNENLRKTILLPENNKYTVLPRGTSGIDILKSLVKHDIPILLDSGALMLELSNEKVAQVWLKLLMLRSENTYKAAVYFDEDHNLRVKDSNHLDESSPYDLSPYREKMDQCIVYLDDAHTRGTDLKIPPPSKACVTLCAGITRDKMVQACMRMRLLGRGHTISFYASDEAHSSIQSNAAANIGDLDIVDWIFENSGFVPNLENPCKIETTIPVLQTVYKAADVVQRLDILNAILASNSDTSVLLDTGGLMSELSNAEVAAQWVNDPRSKEWKGVVYFNENKLTLKHNPLILPDEDIAFEKSEYAKTPETCLFYVDAANTAGGSFLIQYLSTEDREACVTLCPGFTKDRLTQCIILLENSLSVLFLASRDAAKEIESFVSKNLGSRHVMDWVCENSRKFEKDGLIYWSGSGINYAHKQTVENIFYRTSRLDADYKNLGKRCCDLDFLTLKEMYGEHRHDLLYTEVLRSHVERKKLQIERKLSPENRSSHWPDVEKNIFDPVCKKIVRRCENKIGSKRVLGQLLDEEHEKENEEEAEEERQISRPPSRVAADHRLSLDVVNFMETGILAESDDIQYLHLALKRTKVFLIEEWCGEKLFVTRDFVDVIKSSDTGDKEDEFLRTPNWVASVQHEKGVLTMLLLSPFEVDELIPMIRSNKSVASIRMFAPRMIPRQSVLINTPKLALSPPARVQEASAPVPPSLLAPLYMFSGTLYFQSSNELDAFCYFTGILPRDWTQAQQEAFNAKKIDTRGFILAKYREEVSPKHAEFCNFGRNPDELVRGIIEARHGLFPESSHVAQVLDCRRVSNYEN